MAEWCTADGSCRRIVVGRRGLGKVGTEGAAGCMKRLMAEEVVGAELVVWEEGTSCVGIVWQDQR